MTDWDREQWDYWEKRRHDAAHEEKAGGCLGPLFGLILVMLLGLPLLIVTIDFYAAVLCEWRPISNCGKTIPILQWRKAPWWPSP